MKHCCRFIILFFFFACLCNPTLAQDWEEDSLSIVTEDTTYSQQSETAYDEQKVKSNFDTITTAGAVAVRKIDDSTLARLKREDDYWYADLKPEKAPVKKGNNEIRISKGLSSLLWILMIAVLIGAIVWALAGNNISLFRKRSAAKPVGETLLPQEDIFSYPYDREIEKAVLEKQHRTATRYLYLRTLRDLAQNDLISYGQDKTNSDYLTQLHGTSYYKAFFGLTRTFDYVWYGQQEPDEAGFGAIAVAFEQFKKSMGS